MDAHAASLGWWNENRLGPGPHSVLMCRNAESGAPLNHHAMNINQNSSFYVSGRAGCAICLCIPWSLGGGSRLALGTCDREPCHDGARNASSKQRRIRLSPKAPGPQV